MSIWPSDFFFRTNHIPDESLRPFRCLLFMPFRDEFDEIATVIEETVKKQIEELYTNFGFHLPEIKRLDWVKEAGVIHDQIWRELLYADIVFCDLTGYNPNVMFELGVTSAIKKCYQVILIKNKETEQKSAFDISPIRVFEYDPSDLRSADFIEKIKAVTHSALIGFPDRRIPPTQMQLPLEIDFSTSNQDDDRIYTPPICHRRVLNGIFEFGSLFSYPHSWASISNLKIRNLSLEIKARFMKMLENQPKIAVAVRSQHFYANYGHIIVLGSDGSIFITQPDNEPPRYYKDIVLRPPTEIDPFEWHSFKIIFNDDAFSITVDDFTEVLPVASMQRVNGEGLVRFHATRSWMGIQSIKLQAA